ncbi:Aldo/keto reductase [Choiromyces venosus 120613-1]|uniref:Aldo/keto reductase n=1 Tax=Choiromyces venosus 120613-1 TaxID=1336337 RepID=A0A3N4K4W3_9PEZI|nr:Aldo/keto reductase [Choiromyces venosus 120613-1]
MPKFTIQDVLPLPHTPLKIPRIGFGVFRSPPNQCVKSCLAALKTGYRHIDTAQFYENEEEVGEAVRQSGLKRSDVFVTTKIMNPEGSVEKTLESLRASVKRIGLGWVDLFLIHTPSSGPDGRREMWEALEKLKNEGGAKSIGVSNYGVKHMEEIKGYSRTIPAVNQIELHPWLQQSEIVDHCFKEGIVVEAYAPIVRAQKNDDPDVVSIAEAHSVTPAQVLIRWSLQKGFVPLPKSDNPERIKSNADVYGFELSDEEMGKLNGKALPGGEGAICPYIVNCP